MFPVLLAVLELDSVRGPLHILVSHTLIEGPDHHEVDLAGVVPGGHLWGQVKVHQAISHQVLSVTDDLGSGMIQSIVCQTFTKSYLL